MFSPLIKVQDDKKKKKKKKKKKSTLSGGTNFLKPFFFKLNEVI